MAVLYNVPSIGSDETHFGQRGPTCWYYSSKMLLKFHHKLDNKKDEVYKQFKTLHTLRQILTDSGGETADEVIELLKQRRNKMNEYEKAIRLLKSKTRTESQEKSLATMQAKRTGLQKARIDEAIKQLEKEENEGLSRLNLLTTFVPDAGFHKVNPEQYAKPEDVIGLLERWGPFYTGGTVVATRDKIKGTGKLAGTEQIMSVEEFKPTGSHAIVVIGASPTTVYFKDPHQTNEIRSMELKTFHKGLHQDASDFLIAINCDDGWDTDEANCVHMRTQTHTVPA
jgi:hypothetical protein